MNRPVTLRAASRAHAPFDDLRERFPAAQAWTYLNVGSRGIISDNARQAAMELVDGHWQVDVGKDVLAPLLRDCRSEFARLIGGAPAEVAITKNVSEGVNAVGTALDWQPGDNVVLCTDLEHPNNVYLWYGLLRRFGVEVRSVPPRGGEIDVPAMIAAMDRRTRLVTAPSVTFTPGFRTDLAAIGMAARALDALFLVDGVQSCGVLHVDVARDHVDALVTSTSKGLLGMMGLGFLWVREAWLPRLNPVYVARNSIATRGHYSEIESTDFAYALTAERFEIGNYNYVGIAAAEAALREINAVGVSAIEAHVLRLAERLRSGLEDLGYQVQRPARTQASSHLVTLGERGAGNAYTTDDPRLNALIAALDANRVRYSVRRGLVRFGLHMYNNEADVGRVLEIARATVLQRSAEQAQ